MVYEYQKETIEHLKELSEKLEEKTESRMSLKIGFMRGEIYENNEYVEEKGDLYLLINHGNIFRMVFNRCGLSFHDDFDVFDSEAYVKFNSNIFLKLNEWIDEIYENKKEREEFHRNLNLELKALNKSL